MNPFEQMELKQSAYTATDREVHDMVVNNLDAVLRGSATSLAKEFDISQPAITRFCKKLGYNGFAEFKGALYQYHKSAAMSDSPETVIDWYCKLLQRVPAAMAESDVDGIAERLLASRQVVTTGFHKSSLPAELLDMNLSKFGIVSYFSPYDRLSTSERTLTSDDTLVVFSASSSAYKETLESIRENDPERRPRVVVATMSTRSPLRKLADDVVWLPNYQNQRYTQYLESQVTFMVFVDLLTNAIAQKASA